MEIDDNDYVLSHANKSSMTMEEIVAAVNAKARSGELVLPDETDARTKTLMLAILKVMNERYRDLMPKA